MRTRCAVLLFVPYLSEIRRSCPHASLCVVVKNVGDAGGSSAVLLDRVQLAVPSTLVKE